MSIGYFSGTRQADFYGSEGKINKKSWKKLNRIVAGFQGDLSLPDIKIYI